MNKAPHIMRLISPGHHASWRLTLPGPATLLRAGGQKPDVAPFKRLLNAFWSGVSTPVSGLRLPTSGIRLGGVA